jgi:hypothetical protein
MSRGRVGLGEVAGEHLADGLVLVNVRVAPSITDTLNDIPNRIDTLTNSPPPPQPGQTVAQHLRVLIRHELVDQRSEIGANPGAAGWRDPAEQHYVSAA